MSQLMEALVSSGPEPAVVCPTHYTPTHHAYLHPPSHPQCHPSPSPSKTASLWTDPPMPLPSPSLTISQQQSSMCHTDSLINRPQTLQIEYSTVQSSTPPTSPDTPALQPQSASVIAERPTCSPSYKLQDFSCNEDMASNPIRSRIHSPSPQDGEDEDPCQSSGCSPQTSLGTVYCNPTQNL